MVHHTSPYIQALSSPVIMASPSGLEDAFANIHHFNPKKQAKIKLWYPKLEAAQRKARTALAEMMHVLNAPPISILTPAFTLWAKKRKSYIAAYDEAWKQFHALSKAYKKAPKPSCVCTNCIARYNNSMNDGAHTNPSTSKPAAVEPATTKPAAAPRRSSRLAAKPRTNYKMKI